MFVPNYSHLLSRTIDGAKVTMCTFAGWKRGLPGTPGIIYLPLRLRFFPALG